MNYAIYARVSTAMPRLITHVLLAFSLLFGLFLLVIPARAQGETCEIILFDWEGEGNSLGWTVYDDFYGNSAVSFNTDHLEFFQTGNGTSGGSIASQPGINYTIQAGDVLAEDFQILGGEIVHIMRLHTVDSGQIDVFTYGNDRTGGARITRNFDLTPYAGETIDWIEIFNFDSQNGDRYLNLFEISIASEVCEPEGSDNCPLVENANFTDTTPTDWIIPGDGLATGNWLLQNGAVITDSNLILGRSDSASQRLGALLPNVDFQVVISVSTVTGSPRLRMTMGNGLQIVEVSGAGRYTSTLTSPPTVGTAILTIDNISSPPDETEAEIDFLCIYLGGGPAQTCDLVPNSSFDDSSAWSLYQASIATSILTLNPFGTASQNLVLNSDTAYGGVISITNVLTTTDNPVLLVTVGDDLLSPINLIGEGEYQFSFETPANSPPALGFTISNQNLATVLVDSICVYIGATGPSEGCIAPINGAFNTAENWTFLRGAEWNSPSGKALLPYPDVALLVSSSTYSLPTITTGQNLLMAFDARKIDNNETGAIMGRVYAGSSVNWTFETYGTEYTFETSLNTLAGQNNAEIAFVNPGLTGSELISSTSDVVLDNVCVFVANRGPRLPAPTDPDAIPPVDLGFNFTSCDQVDGILAFFGVNIRQYRADYEAGASVWDPIGWVPWLIAAGWNIFATWLCVFLAALVSFVDLLQYFVNLFLNYADWLLRSFPAWRNWLTSWLNWLAASLTNLSNAYAAFLTSWSDWIGDSLANLSNWIGDSLANLSDGLAQFLANWSDWIAESLANMSFWIGAELAAWSDWIAASLANAYDWLANYLFTINGSRAILNILIEAWNIYLAAISEIISLALDLLVFLWNLLVPFLKAVWAYVSGGSNVFANPLLAMVLAVFNLVLMVVFWVWANVFMVVSIPINFYYAFDDGVKSEAFAYLMSCTATNFWCQLLAGIQLVNQTSAHTLMYPIVIVGIIIGSIVVFWKELWALFSTHVS